MRTKRQFQVGIKTASVLFSAFALCFSACKKEGVASVQMPIMPNSCYVYGSTLTGDQATLCCDGSGNAKNPLPDGCPRPQGVTPTLSTMSSFNGAVTTARSSLASADGFVGAGTIAHNNIAAATAGDAPAAADSNAGKLSGTSLAGSPLNGTGSGGSGSGSSSSGSGGTSGSNPSAGADIRTQAAGGTAADQQQVALMEQSGSMQGSGGGGSGGHAKKEGGSAWDNLFGGGGAGGASGSGSTGITMGGRGPASDPNASASSDPEDYFSRLKRGDNIFKVVEHRYTNKARDWATRDASELATKAKALVK